MDVFARTFLSAAAEAGLASPVVSRHLPVFSRCVGADDAATLVARCQSADRPLGGDYLLLLTRHRLVVTRETWALRRLRLHLNTGLRHLHHVSWNPDPRRWSVELAATAVDGVRERFRLRAGGAPQLARLEEQLAAVFRPGAYAEHRPARPAARRDLVAVPRPAVALS